MAVCAQAKLSIFEAILKLLAKTQRLWDRPAPRALLERLVRSVLKRIAPNRPNFRPDMVLLPKLPRRHLRAICILNSRPILTARSTRVACFHGCAANYFDDGVGMRIGVLQKALSECLSSRSVVPDADRNLRPRDLCSDNAV